MTAFLHAHAIPLAKVALILAVVFANEIARVRRRASLRRVYDRLFPFSAADAGVPGLSRGPTHDDVSRDSRRGDLSLHDRSNAR